MHRLRIRGPSRTVSTMPIDTSLRLTLTGIVNTLPLIVFIPLNYHNEGKSEAGDDLIDFSCTSHLEPAMLNMLRSHFKHARLSELALLQGHGLLGLRVEGGVHHEAIHKDPKVRAHVTGLHFLPLQCRKEGAKRPFHLDSSCSPCPRWHPEDLHGYMRPKEPTTNWSVTCVTCVPPLMVLMEFTKETS